MAFTIRAASPTDLPSIATLDIAAHKPTSALLNINLLPPDDIHALYLSRYAHFLSQPDHYRFLVAITSKNETTHGGDIAGFLVGVRPKLESSEEDEWNPVFPEDAPAEKLAWFSGLMKSMKEDKMKYFKNDMWELEALATSPSYQRRGVGSLLLTHWLQEVDIARGTLYVRASRSGRGLYEKLGCVNKGEHSVDVSDHGWTQPIVNTNMIRAAKGT
ncbi:acyl-CoA N-acyltransferase [Bisporella sp. PMI_857]|nr:acyl-CoA N-acyltransferase [Bisporella sp. PMI_857]